MQRLIRYLITFLVIAMVLSISASSWAQSFPDKDSLTNRVTMSDRFQEQYELSNKVEHASILAALQMLAKIKNLPLPVPVPLLVENNYIDALMVGHYDANRVWIADYVVLPFGSEVDAMIVEDMLHTVDTAEFSQLAADYDSGVITIEQLQSYFF